MSKQDENLDEFADERTGNWATVELSEIARKRSENVSPESADLGRHVGLEHIEPNTPVPDWEPIDGLSSTKRRFEPGDVLFAKLRPNLEKAAQPDFEGIASTDIFPIVAEHGVNSKYLLYRLSSKPAFDHARRTSMGTRMPRTSWGLFGKFEFDLPPIEEQRKIASVLYTVDGAIQKTEEIIEQVDRVQRGLMDAIFRQGYGSHEIYQDTPAGRFPSSWEMVQLEKLLLEDMSYGILKPGDYDDDGVRMIRATDISHGRLVEPQPFKVSQSKADEYKRTKLAEKDIILSVMGTVGRSMCVPASLQDANLNRALARLRFDPEQILPEFVDFWFRSPRTQSYFETQKFGTAQPRLNLGFLNKMKLPVPSLDEQKHIIDVLANVDQCYWKERTSKSNLQRLKQGLMQDLLSGEVRTHDKDIEVVDEVLQHG